MNTSRLLVSQSLRRAALARPTAAPAVRTAKRFMGGSKMDVNKNQFVEEWNGRREISEKAFEYGSKEMFRLFFTVGVFPVFCYFLCKNELQTSINTCVNDNGQGLNGKPKYM